MSSFVLIHKKGENNRKAFVLNFKFRASHTVETMSLLQGINKKKERNQTKNSQTKCIEDEYRESIYKR